MFGLKVSSVLALNSFDKCHQNVVKCVEVSVTSETEKHIWTYNKSTKIVSIIAILFFNYVYIKDIINIIL